MKTLNKADQIFFFLSDYYKDQSPPSVTEIAKLNGNDPFRVLISTIISLRTKDEVTLKVSKKLFANAPDCKTMSNLEIEEIEKLIFPANFYKTKAKNIKETSIEILKSHKGKVPDTIDELLKFKGVGRKTATLVMIEGFGRNEICVDTHVHRVSNRLGIVYTKNPLETEIELKKIFPENRWNKINEMFVVYGQKVCKPKNPFCSYCKLESLCDKKYQKI